MEVTAPQDVVWVKCPVIKMHDNQPADSQWEYEITVPDWLAAWDVFGDWEVARFDSMRDNLQNGDVLFDIGAEIGWQSVIYAKMVGPENIVLVEPSGDLWPNIMGTWYNNFLQAPLACYYGLFSGKTTSKFVLAKRLFPVEAEGNLVHELSYVYIHEHAARMPAITLDDYVKLTSIVPAALTIDVEGAELLVLQGAENTLTENDLKVWVSVHPELSLRNYLITNELLHLYMTSLGYVGEHLGTDHEEHWLFTKERS